MKAWSVWKDVHDAAVIMVFMQKYTCCITQKNEVDMNRVEYIILTNWNTIDPDGFSVLKSGHKWELMNWTLEVAFWWCLGYFSYFWSLLGQTFAAYYAG